jgi:hypothetical protein
MEKVWGLFPFKPLVPKALNVFCGSMAGLLTCSFRAAFPSLYFKTVAGVREN